MFAEESTRSNAPFEDEADWRSLVQLAAFHRVAPLLRNSLRNARSPTVPPSVLADLEAYVRSASSRSLFLTGELVRLLKRLAAQAIPAIPFKGPALAVSLYGDPALRQFDDLDILVRREDYPTAKSLLRSLGYRPEIPLNKRQENAYLRNKRHEKLTIVKESTKIEVEIHCGIVPPDSPFRQNLKEAWERREPLFFAGMETTALSSEDLLMSLCAHGSRHLWCRLQWLCDVARLIRRRPNLDWGRLAEQARMSGGQRMLFLGLCLARDVLATPLPPEIERGIGRDPQTGRLADEVKRRFFEGPLVNRTTEECALFRPQLIDGLRDRLSYWRRHGLGLLNPTRADWTSIRLPDPLFPLYYALRPVRLAGKYGWMAAHHFSSRRRRR
ncbi:nucleotidyltransferase family protein [Candidatus Sumerlaeota bacterium]|nr:nucleotidyltransferase family protein [Candidatus Sumerlaeota bacterium]